MVLDFLALRKMSKREQPQNVCSPFKYSNSFCIHCYHFFKSTYHLFSHKNSQFADLIQKARFLTISTLFQENGQKEKLFYQNKVLGSTPGVDWELMGASLVAQYREASVCNAGDLGSIPGSGRSPGEGNGLENPMDRGAWQATVRGVAKSRTRLRDFTYHSKKGRLLPLQPSCTGSPTLVMDPENSMPILGNHPPPLLLNPLITDLGIYPKETIRALQKNIQMLIVMLFYKSKKIASISKNQVLLQ